MASALYEYVQQDSERRQISLRSQCSLITPSINKNYGRQSFKYNAIKIMKEEILDPVNELSFDID